MEYSQANFMAKQLNMAIYRLDLSAIKTILQEGANPNIMITDPYTDEPITALLKVAQMADLYVNLQKTDIEHGLPQSNAATRYLVNMKTLLKITKNLLADGADPSIKNNKGQTVRDLLNNIDQKYFSKEQRKTFSDILKSLSKAETSKAKKKQKKNINTTEQLHDAIKTLNKAKVFQLANNINVNDMDQNGNTSLNVAASTVINIYSTKNKNTRSTDLEKISLIIQGLLNEGANPTIKNKASKTAWDKLKQFEQEEAKFLSPEEQQTFNVILSLLKPISPQPQPKPKNDQTQPRTPSPSPSPSKPAESISEQAWSQFPEAKKLRDQYKHMKEVYGAVLGVTPQASRAEINKAYRELSLKWHPDKYEGNKELATEVQSILNNARNTLIGN